jgi:hypothetical protein
MAQGTSNEFSWDAPPPLPTTIPIAHALKLTGLRQSQLDQLIYEAVLTTVLYGRRQRVTVASLLAYAADQKPFDFEDREIAPC